jgi:hypothetical protein
MYRGKQLEAAAESAAGAGSGRAAGATLHSRSKPTTAPPRRTARISDDEFLAHYLRRIDPAVAASFTKEQRHAIRIMFGDRGATRHAVDVRCTFPLGWRRCYLVFLLGRDRRRIIRPRNGLPGDMGDWLAYLVMSLGLLAALFVLLSFVKI